MGDIALIVAGLLVAGYAGLWMGSIWWHWSHDRSAARRVRLASALRLEAEISAAELPGEPPDEEVDDVETRQHTYELTVSHISAGVRRCLETVVGESHAAGMTQAEIVDHWFRPPDGAARTKDLRIVQGMAHGLGIQLSEKRQMVPRQWQVAQVDRFITVNTAQGSRQIRADAEE